jgi:stage III sporulation protein AH
MKLQYFYYAKRREETAMKQLWKRNAVVGTILVFVCAAIFLNGKYAEKVDKPTKVLGQSELVSTDGDVAEVSANAEGKDYFASARLTRQQARDSALSLLKEASENDDVDAETASEAAKSIETLASYTLSEAQIENMVTAKGYEDCVVFMSEDGVSVVVSTGEEGLQTEDIARITDIVKQETGLSAESIKIMEVN